MSFKYEEIKKFTTEELIKNLEDAINSAGGNVTTQFMAEEIRRRETKELNEKMVRFTKWITIMTAVMLVATIVNVIVALANK